MATIATTPRQPIINGSVNPRLTQQDLEAATYDSKVQILWCLQVECEYPRVAVDANPGLVKKLAAIYTYAEIKQIPAEKLTQEILTELKRQQRHREHITRETYASHVSVGREIRAAQRLLGFGGELELSLGKLVGYLLEEGGWNDFDPFEVGRILKTLDETAPRRDCGDDNPNTGTIMHRWSVDGAYIFLKVPYCSGKEVENWQRWYRSTANPTQRKMKADSMRLVVEPCEGFHPDGANLTLVLWWD